ncbi:MAG: hypothetical protein FWC50_04895 [Planctomycetaceae bacterium]|nr:hypothetical protein [Planctomycetaceae bacterium]
MTTPGFRFQRNKIHSAHSRRNVAQPRIDEEKPDLLPVNPRRVAGRFVAVAPPVLRPNNSAGFAGFTAAIFVVALVAWGNFAAILR